MTNHLTNAQSSLEAFLQEKGITITKVPENDWFTGLSFQQNNQSIASCWHDEGLHVDEKQPKDVKAAIHAFTSLYYRN